MRVSRYSKIVLVYVFDAKAILEDQTCRGQRHGQAGRLRGGRRRHERHALRDACVEGENLEQKEGR